LVKVEDAEEERKKDKLTNLIKDKLTNLIETNMVRGFIYNV